MAFNEVYTKLLFSRQQPKPAMVTAIAAMAVNFALVSVLAARFGAGGIAAASAAAVAVNAVFNHLWLRHTGTRLLSGGDWGDLAKMLASAAVMSVVVWAIWSRLDLGRMAGVVLSVGCGVAVYAVMILLLREREAMAAVGRLSGRFNKTR